MSSGSSFLKINLIVTCNSRINYHGLPYGEVGAVNINYFHEIDITKCFGGCRKWINEFGLGLGRNEFISHPIF